MTARRDDSRQWARDAQEREDPHAAPRGLWNGVRYAVLFFWLPLIAAALVIRWIA